MAGISVSRTPSLILLAALMASTAVALVGESATGRATAQSQVKVTILIERLRAFGCWGSDTFLGCIGGEDADFYPRVSIDGSAWMTRPTIDDQDDIRPNWEFSADIDASRVSVPVVIEVWDEDGGLRGDDDHVDLTQAGGDNLELTVNLAPCMVTGNLPGGSGVCNATLNDRGGKSTDKAEIWFRVFVSEGPRSGNLRLRCLHTPLWPDSSDSVQITATALNAVNGQLMPLTADSIEIWVNETTAPVQTCATAGTCTVGRGPFAGPTFNYGCRVTDGPDVVFTGWRTVDVGAPLPGNGPAARAIYVGPRHDKVDLVFVPDGASYPGGARNAAFMTAVTNILNTEYYAEDVFLTYQDAFNVWLATDSGNAENDCDSEAPGNWDDDYGFADAGGIVHTDGSIRDCAPGGERFFSALAGASRVALHESGHRPFGLADEYCCDGGYYQRDRPNLYEEFSDCQSDVPFLQGFDIRLGLTPRTSAACREFNDDGWWIFQRDWNVSDPASNDLMADTGRIQGADLRRIEWMFTDVCRLRGRC